MCLMLYMATSELLAPSRTEALSIEPIPSGSKQIPPWFSNPYVYFVGAHTGCSCGFPSADEPVAYFEGMFEDDDDRRESLQSVRELLATVTRCLEKSPSVELFPVWTGEETEPAAGVIELELERLDPDAFVFAERYMHRITRDPAPSGS